MLPDCISAQPAANSAATAEMKIRMIFDLVGFVFMGSFRFPAECAESVQLLQLLQYKAFPDGLERVIIWGPWQAIFSQDSPRWSQVLQFLREPRLTNNFPARVEANPAQIARNIFAA